MVEDAAEETDDLALPVKTDKKSESNEMKYFLVYVTPETSGVLEYEDKDAMIAGFQQRYQEYKGTASRIYLFAGRQLTYHQPVITVELKDGDQTSPVRLTDGNSDENSPFARLPV